MELLFLCGSLFLPLILGFLFLVYNHQSSRGYSLPPGKMGWPVVGESFEFLSTGWKGHPEKFIFDRLSQYAPSQVFKTSIVNEKVAVMCGASCHKFLFSNENKLVHSWWPSSVEKLFPSSSNSTVTSKKMRKQILPNFLKPEALQSYIAIMDMIGIQHMEAVKGKSKDKVEMFPFAKHYTFKLACRIFLSIEDPISVAKFGVPFKHITMGIMSIPIDIPGTQYNQAIKAARTARNDLMSIIKQRKLDLADGKASPTQDILSHMLLTPDRDGEFLSEADISTNIMALLLGGHETASIVCSFVVKYLAELPHIYEAVYKEQMEIANSKKQGEYLNWEDLKKMKYSWNVACEAMRLAPPVPGTFRVALSDFTYDGFQIPKGWKLYWTVYSTHKNPECFPEPEKFDPTRYEGTGPAPYTFVPFGGGPRMCPGNEYARLEILVFIHNLVKRFKWELLDPNEKIVTNPAPVPQNGLPVRLISHPLTVAANGL